MLQSRVEVGGERDRVCVRGGVEEVNECFGLGSRKSKVKEVLEPK